MRPKNRNMYCALSDLTNEAAVEQFFVNRLLEDLGYADSDIKPKTSLKALVVSLGVKRFNYRPDYGIKVDADIRWVLDAKGPEELLDDHVDQVSGYCLGLNRLSKHGNPTDKFVLTNGVELRVYNWDDAAPVLTLAFDDFQKTNTKYKQLVKLLQRKTVGAQPVASKPAKPFNLRTPSLVEINASFAWCHQYIHRKDSLSQAAAFIEFVKIIFLKLLSDRKYRALRAEGKIPQATDIPFTVAWIDRRESDHRNPMSDVQFKKLLEQLEDGIRSKARKRIFDSDEQIRLSAETIKGVVRKLEDVDLLSIDADLNGRLFETFLNATMRGKDLGQYFTPRSVVKLAVALADPQVSRDQQDIVMDACCGTGGFLIEALAAMWNVVNNNRSLSDDEKQRLRLHIANNRIYGDDISRDPPLARIARMNMFLHGDGGSKIFEADILDKKLLEVAEVESPETREAKRELRVLLRNPSHGFADVILTNPPFAKEYHRKDPRDAAILDEYELAYEGDGRARAPKTTVRSSVLFLERYLDILKPGGRLVAVVDDSILGSKKYREVRKWLRDRYLVRAVVSLPGDAFQRSLARVKTSLVYLTRKQSESDVQGEVDLPGFFGPFVT